MVTLDNAPQMSQPPARQLRLLANFAFGFAVVFALVAFGLAGSAAAVFVQIVTGETDPQLPWAVVSFVLNLAAAVVTGAIAYRLGFDVRRTVRGWHTAMAERSRALQRR